MSQKYARSPLATPRKSESAIMAATERKLHQFLRLGDKHYHGGSAYAADGANCDEVEQKR